MKAEAYCMTLLICGTIMSIVEGSQEPLVVLLLVSLFVGWIVNVTE